MQSLLHILNFPIIRPLCDIANLFECMAMFYFVKGLRLGIAKLENLRFPFVSALAFVYICNMCVRVLLLIP